MSDKSLRLVAMPHFNIERGRIDRYVPEGASVAQHLREIGWCPDELFARVFIDGRLIEKAEWEYAVPRAGQSLTVRAIPMDGGPGGGGGKMAMRIVGMLAIVALSIFTAGAGLPAGLAGLAGSVFGPGAAGFMLSGTASLLAGTIISVGGMLALNALVPPPRPRLADLSGFSGSPTLSLTGSSNKLAPYARIPRVYGRHRIYPPLAARTFTEVVGNQQYLRMLFCLGYGPLALSDFKIGETPLASFSGVETEIRAGYDNDPPLVLFSRGVYEDNLSILLKFSTSWVQRTSQEDAVELSVDVTFPLGLGDFRNVQQHTEALQPYSVAIEVAYRLVGTSSWTSTTATAVAASKTTAFSGANNDLVFTARKAGADGNNIIVSFTAGASLSVIAGTQLPSPPVTDPRGIVVTYAYRYINVTIVQGFTTANAVAAAIAANTFANSLVIVSNAPGNNGTGTISLQVIPGTGPRFIGTVVESAYHLSGGKNPVPIFTVASKQTNQLRFSRRWTVPEKGQYEVRVRKFTADATDPLIRDQVYWTSLRTILGGDSTTLRPGFCYVAIRIKATDQLDGVVDTFNCVAQSILPDWNGTEWQPAPTSNPASIYRDVMQGKANKRPKPDSQMDLPTIQAFHARCQANEFSFNANIDFPTTVKQLRQDVLAAGRGTFGLRDMKYSVVEDLLQNTPVDVITPRTSFGFQWTKRFIEIPHAFKVRFVDEANNWQQGERIVYADGYNKNNATIFEEADAGLGVTSSTQVWKMKRRELAEALLRADDYLVQMDFQHLTFTRGDRVQFQHDVIMAGVQSARILSTTVNGSGDYLTITLDDVFIMDASRSYAVRITKLTGSQSVHAITTIAGETNVCTFATPAPASLALTGGELVAVGLLGSETLDCIVKNIRPGQDYSATVQLADYAPAIQSADVGPIPSYESHLTLPALDQQVISLPIVDQVQSDEDVLMRDVDGSYQARIVITLHFASGYRRPVTHLEAQYRVASSSDESDWAQIYAPVSGTASHVSIMPVEEGTSYALRVRSINDDFGLSSPWVSIEPHTVIGKTTRPPDVTGLTFTSDGIQWAYPDPPVDFDGFLVRVRPGVNVVWEDAFQLNDVPITSTSYPLVPDGSTRIIMVKAIDVAGLESAAVAWILQDAAALVLRNLAETIDERALGFPGVKTNCTVVGGNLTADSQTLFWSNDTALFWSSDSTLFWQGTYKDMTYVATITPPAKWELSTMRIQLGITAQGWAVDYRPSSTVIFWSNNTALFWSSDSAFFWSQVVPDFSTWPGALELPKHQAYEFRISAVGGQVQGVVSAFNVLFDMPDLQEVLPRISIPAGGGRLPLTKPFQFIKAVFPTIVGTNHAATRVKTIDTLLSPGPLEITYDDAGNEVAGDIYAVVNGY